MQYYSFFLFVLFLFNLSKSETLSDVKIKLSSLNKNCTLYSSHISNSLRGSENDLNMDNVYIEDNANGYVWYAGGSLTIYNTKKYLAVGCGFSKGKPTQSEIGAFAASYVYSSVKVSVGSNDHSDDHFSCYLTDGYYYYGKYIKFKSLSVEMIIIIVVVVIIVICICACGCSAYNHRKNISARNNNNSDVIITRTPLQSNTHINTITNRIPVTNNRKNMNVNQIPNIIPLSNSMNVNTEQLNDNPTLPTMNNQVMYIIPNSDAEYQYYATNNHIPITNDYIATVPITAQTSNVIMNDE